MTKIFGPPASRTAPHQSGAGRSATGHTPLDQLLIDVVEDSLQGKFGALSTDDLSEAVDEFVKLNGRRHQSYFHPGFRNALLDRPFDSAPTPQNEGQARWYWAGVVQGLARSKSWQRIVELYDAADTVRTLGDGLDPASLKAGEPIVEALWHTGRTTNLHVFVSVSLAKEPTIFHRLLKVGTQLLRSRSPGEARTLFDLLLAASESLRPDDPLAKQIPTVRRRKAHCLRLLGEHQGAENLLRALLRESDPGVHAMVHADLGLLQGRFALLDELRIPGDESERRDLVDRLKAGERHYREAVAISDAAFASHGHYCLGVLALADDALGESRFEEADIHLEQAHAEMPSNNAYPESLLARLDLYLGVAKSQLLDAAEIRHAARLIVSGFAGAEIPHHLVACVVQSLDCAEESIEMVAAPLLESGGAHVLDAIADTRLLTTSPLIAERLYERAHQANRRKSLATMDLRLGLKGYLGVGNLEQADQVLEELKQHALDGSGVTEFLDILNEPDLHQPAWDMEEAAIESARCLEAQGEYLLALEKLRGLFHRYMTAGERDNALDVLERLGSYGLNLDSYVDLWSRYNSSKRISDPTSPAPSPDAAVAPVTVLVVGGDEGHAKVADEVEAKLAARDEQVTVEFVHTGWGPNWNQYLDKIKTRIENCDAVVVMRHIRTQLGRHTRAMCRTRSVPWRLCWSGSRSAQVEAILKAAGAARGRQ